MGPKERHLHRYQKNEDVEMNYAVQKILSQGGIGHRSDKKRKTASDSRTRNRGGSPTTKR